MGRRYWQVLQVIDAREARTGPEIAEACWRHFRESTSSGVLGDPAHVGLTRQAEDLGWRGAGTAFDVLPLIVDLPDGSVYLEDVPADCVLEVAIEHPEQDFVADLNLRWHATPAVSSTTLEFGGLRYTAAPFSGWYVNTEVAARNLAWSGSKCPVLRRPVLRPLRVLRAGAIGAEGVLTRVVRRYGAPDHVGRKIGAC